MMQNALTASISHQAILTEILRDTRLSAHHARKAAEAIVRVRWGRQPKSYADYLRAARLRQRGAGFTTPLLTVTDEQLSRADADISWRLDSDGRAAAKAERDAEFGAAPFRLSGFGLERTR
ncbi:MAG: hypothetical protein ABI240_11305 [Sphingomonas sp.]